MSNKESKSLNTLAIDIGGTFIKMMVLDPKGKALTPYLRELTPHPATMESMFQLMVEMMKQLKVGYDRVSAGFPGVVQNGTILTAPNLHASWIGIPLQNKLKAITQKPTLVANDADIQGYGDIRGKGLEMVITLGTGLGSALFIHGQLVPNLELGHHPFRDNLTYEECLGKKALEREGIKKWRATLNDAILLWKKIFNFDCLYLGGGNAHKINFILPKNVKLSDNIEGVLGGIKLWTP